MSINAGLGPHAGLTGVLLDFQQNPGKYAVAMREPAAAFAQIGRVLQLAAGKEDALSGERPETLMELGSAARFFVRMALLRPGMDHYAMLGLQPTADSQTIKEHYRLLIRLTHPDFSLEAHPWPSDAAARVNLAYDTLISPDKRRAYDTSLVGSSGHLSKPVGSSVISISSPSKNASPENKPKLRMASRGIGWQQKGLPIALAGLVALALVILTSMGPGDQEFELVVAEGNPQTNSEPAESMSGTVTDVMVSGEATSPSFSQAADQVVTPIVTPPASERSKMAPLKSVGSVNGAVRSRAAQPVHRTLPDSGEPALSLSYSLATSRSGGDSSQDSMPPASAVRPTEPLMPSAQVAPVEPAVAKVSATPERPRMNTGQASADMQSAQSLLTELVQALGSGQREQVERWMERSGTSGGMRTAFGDRYAQTLAGATVRGIEKVRFTSLPDQDPQTVMGSIQLRLQLGEAPSFVREIRVRAQFTQRNGVTSLSQLAGE